jgi:hypothetical protein
VMWFSVVINTMGLFSVLLYTATLGPLTSSRVLRVLGGPKLVFNDSVPVCRSVLSKSVPY